MLSDDPTLEEIEAVFANDRFATEAAGCRVVSGERGRAVCSMELADVVISLKKSYPFGTSGV